MFERIICPHNFASAYCKTQMGSPKYRTGAIQFAANESANLEALRQEVAEGRYLPGDYFLFRVYEPKERVIYAPKYRDKIVQHAVNNVLRDFYEPKFIHDSYACIRGKGNDRAVLRIQRHQRAASINYRNPWLIKADVQRFFYSIDRPVLLDIVYRKIDCQKTRQLISVIVQSSPDELGLPLGNLTSQLLANVLMNEMDQYVKRTLGVRYYVRYADDLVCIVNGKAHASDVLAAMQAFARDALALKLPARKSFIRPMMQGVETLGYRIHPARITLTSNAKSALIRRVKRFDRRLKAKSVTAPEVAASLRSWYAYASLAQCQLFTQSACMRTDSIRFNPETEKFKVRAP